MENIVKRDTPFNFIRFLEFLKKHNILTAAITAVLSERISDFTDTFVGSMLMPIINRDADSDGVSDIKHLEEYTFTVFSIKFRVGRVLISMIKFVVITYFIFLVSEFMNKN